MTGSTNERQATAMVWILLGSFLAVFCVSLYTHLYSSAFEFLVEAPCDAASNTCFVRDCEEEECPPNNLSSYRVFTVSAVDFARCADNSCLNVCAGGTVCVEITCEPDDGDTCAGPPMDL